MDPDSEDFVEGPNLRRILKLRSMRDPEKQRRKEEKKEEKRKIKEDEKRQKELQKKERKMKKKDSKTGLMSQMSMNVLEDMAQSDENLVPLFVEKCVAFIEEEGLGVEGIFRVPGNRQHVELLLDQTKEGRLPVTYQPLRVFVMDILVILVYIAVRCTCIDVDFLVMRTIIFVCFLDPTVDIPSLDIPVNAVATALKQFFSDLPEPLIPPYLLEELKEATGKWFNKIDVINNISGGLSGSN